MDKGATSSYSRSAPAGAAAGACWNTATARASCAVLRRRFSDVAIDCSAVALLIFKQSESI